MGSKSRSFIFDTLTGVVETRGRAGALAIALLCWSVMRFFGTLIRATNRAWGAEVNNWWRLPAKSLLFLVVVLAMIPLGMALPVIVRSLQGWLVSHTELSEWNYSFAGFVLRVGILFLGLAVFYRMAPRRTTTFDEVWAASAVTTALLVAVQTLFGFYLASFRHIESRVRHLWRNHGHAAVDLSIRLCLHFRCLPVCCRRCLRRKSGAPDVALPAGAFTRTQNRQHSHCSRRRQAQSVRQPFSDPSCRACMATPSDGASGSDRPPPTQPRSPPGA